MANLSFTQGDDGRYTATATANGKYALHVEREAPGLFAVRQSTKSGAAKMSCPLPAAVANGAAVIDWVFDHGYYPVELEFVSSTAVTSAELNEASE